MYFAPFELRKVWCYSDVNWTPLSLSYSSGIPYPVNSLLAQTLNREFHNSLWSLTGANESTNDCMYVQFRKNPLLTFAHICLAHTKFKRYICNIQAKVHDNSWYYP